MQKTLKEEENRQKKQKEEYKESQITTINIFGFIFSIKKIYFSRKDSLKNWYSFLWEKLNFSAEHPNHIISHSF